MKKATKRIPVLERLAKEMKVLSEAEQKRYIGGGDGSPNNPYTYNEYYSLQSGGQWTGGYVVGQGYTDANGYWGGSSGSGSNYYSGSGYDGNYGSGSGYDGNYGSGGNLTDGVNISNSQHFTFNTQSNQAFDQTLKNILQSNSVLKSILHYFDKGYVHMTFGIENNPNLNTGGRIQEVSDESYHIYFNQNLITNGGMMLHNGLDNTGFDWNKVRSPEEALVVALTHEALHAKHYAIFREVVNNHKNTGEFWENRAANEMRSRGFSIELINCFFKQPNPNANFWLECVDNNDIESNLHKYMEINDLGVIEAALNEYRADHTPANGSSSSEPQGSQSNPYTLYQFLNWQGTWHGGWVEGLGFIETINISSNGSSSTGSSANNSSLMDYLDSHGTWSTDGSGNLHWTRTS